MKRKATYGKGGKKLYKKNYLLTFEFLTKISIIKIIVLYGCVWYIVLYRTGQDNFHLFYIWQ